MEKRFVIEWVARIGYTARGVVFLILGILILLAASGNRQHATDMTDAFRVVLATTFGSVSLLVIVIGLLCFAVWRLVQGFLDADHCGSEIKGLSRRGAYTIAGFLYVGFAVIALSVVLGWDNSATGDQVARGWTIWLLEKPFSRWLVGSVGFGFMPRGWELGLQDAEENTVKDSS